MRFIDWLVFVATLAWVVFYGAWRARGKKTADSFTVAGHQVPWYAVGLSIMATQASAVTFISTTGQAFVDGMRFVQFYFGLPIAMVILAYTAVPLFRAAGVYTAYEYLERRFDARVRTLVSAIFLLQRGLALGVTLYAPGVVLAVILGWPDWATTLLVGGLAISYTTSGGAKAIAWSDLQQMIVMTLGLAAAFIAAVFLLPDNVSFLGAVDLAAAAGRLNVITTTLDWNDRYNLWSGLIGGTFLALAYFGTDQTQVQRYLSGESIKASRRGLFLNAAAKIPMQLVVLFIGVMVYVFYVFEPHPVLFQRLEQARLESPGLRASYAPVAERYEKAFDARKAAAAQLVADDAGGGGRSGTASAAFKAAHDEIEAVRRDAIALAQASGGSGASDTNYVFLTFVTEHLPAGLVGLVLAVILGATMTAISAEMTALATVSVVDVYGRYVAKPATDARYLLISRIATVFWGAYAIVAAQFIKRIGSLVEAVNLVGSLFYGVMLGVFVVAFFKRVNALGAFAGVVIGEATVLACWQYTNLAFLWFNVLGCLVVVAVGLAISLVPQTRRSRRSPVL